MSWKYLSSLSLFLLMNILPAMEWSQTGNELIFTSGGRTMRFSGNESEGLQMDGGPEFFIHIVEEEDKVRKGIWRIAPGALGVREISRSDFSLTVQATYRLKKSGQKIAQTPNIIVLNFQLWKDFPVISVSARVINKSAENFSFTLFLMGKKTSAEMTATGLARRPPHEKLAVSSPGERNLPIGEYLFIDYQNGSTLGIIGKSSRHRAGEYIHLVNLKASLSPGETSRESELTFVGSPANYREVENYGNSLGVLKQTAVVQKNAGYGPFQSKDGRLTGRTGTVEFENKEGRLFIKIRCDEPVPEKILQKWTAAGDPIWLDDCAEVSVLCDEQTGGYIHLMVNAAGNLGAVFRNMNKPAGFDLTHITVQTAIHKSAWTVELGVPLKYFDQKLLLEKKLVRLHVNRQHPGGKLERELSGWPTERFHSPESFAQVLLCEYHEFLRKEKQKINNMTLNQTDIVTKEEQKELARAEIPLNYFTMSFYQYKLDKFRDKLHFSEAYSKADSISTDIKSQQDADQLAGYLALMDKSRAEVPARTEILNKLRSALLSFMSGGKPFSVWEKKAWLYLSPQDYPTGCNLLGQEHELHAGIGEYESAMFGVTNFSGQEAEIKVRTEENKAGFDIMIRHGYATRGKFTKGLIYNAFLQLINDKFIMAGNTSAEVMITLNTAGVVAGNHSVTILFASNGVEIRKIIKVKVYPVKMDAENMITPFFNYSDGMIKAGPEHCPAFRKDLDEHYVKTYYLYKLPVFKCSDDGRNLTDYNIGKEQFKISKPGDTFFYFFGWGTNKQSDKMKEIVEKFFKAEYMSETFKRNVKMWLDDWYKYLTDKKLEKDFYIMPYDETTAQIAVEMVKLLKKLCPQFKIAMSVTNTSKAEEIAEVVPALDIVIPHFYSWRDNAGIWKIFQENKVKVVPYFNVMEGADPNESYNVYRRMAWLAHQKGSAGFGTWVYFYVPSSSWEYIQMNLVHIKSEVFKQTLAGAPEKLADKDYIVPTKRWEAYRDGVEDYFYLRMLEKEAMVASSPAPAQKARSLIAKAMSEVCDDANIGQDIASIYKIEILKLLTEIKNAR